MHLDLAIVSVADEASVPVNVRDMTCGRGEHRASCRGLRLSVGGRNIAADMGAKLTGKISLRRGT